MGTQKAKFWLKGATNMMSDQLNEIDEYLLHAYEWFNLEKENIKLYHDSRIEMREFQVSDWVLLYNLWFKLFLGKLKSKWLRYVKVTQVFLFVVVELENEDGKLFKENSQWVKQYVGLPKK